MKSHLVCVSFCVFFPFLYLLFCPLLIGSAYMHNESCLCHDVRSYLHFSASFHVVWMVSYFLYFCVSFCFSKFSIFVSVSQKHVLIGCLGVVVGKITWSKWLYLFIGLVQELFSPDWEHILLS